MDTKVWTGHYDSWVPEELQFPEGTQYDMFHGVAQAHANKNAAIFFDAAAIYRELETWVDAFAAALAAQEVKKGDRILISLSTSPQFIVAYFAIMKLKGLLPCLRA